MSKYKAIVEFDDDHTPTLRNDKTGRITEALTVSKKFVKRNIPDGKVVHAPGAQYNKLYTNVQLFLRKELTIRERGIVAELIALASKKDNSLEPLSDKITREVLAKQFEVGKNTILNIIKKFKNLGIIGTFEVIKRNDDNYVSHSYWVLNPYISYNGKLIEDTISNLFKGTEIHKAFLDKNYSIS